MPAGDRGACRQRPEPWCVRELHAPCEPVHACERQDFCAVCAGCAVLELGRCARAGHYVAFVKSASHWLFFDDETVEPISEAMVQTAFGSPQVRPRLQCRGSHLIGMWLCVQLLLITECARRQQSLRPLLTCRIHRRKAVLVIQPVLIHIACRCHGHVVGCARALLLGTHRVGLPTAHAQHMLTPSSE
jgi:hypothetical protein